MAISQDSSHPTGVRDHNDRSHKASNSTTLIARHRKADAALSLKLAGASWTEIAQTLGYPTPRAALLQVERALVRQLAEEDKVKMRQLAGARLERLLRGIWTKAIDEHSPDQMTAVSRSRELIADYTKLFGLAAPAEVVVHTPTQTELEDWVLRMTTTMIPEAEEADIWEGEVVEKKELGA